MVISVCFTKHCFLINKNKIPIVKVNNCCYKTNLLYESKKNKTEEHRGTKKRENFFSNKRENGDDDCKWVQVLLSFDFNKLDTYK